MERIQWTRSVHMGDVQDKAWEHIESKAKEDVRVGEEETIAIQLVRNKRRGR